MDTNFNIFLYVILIFKKTQPLLDVLFVIDYWKTLIIISNIFKKCYNQLFIYNLLFWNLIIILSKYIIIWKVTQ